jgi:hypothetical protein
LYTPLELRSLRRRTDVVHKFNNKVQAQQIASKSFMRVETKPLGKHQRAKSASMLMGTKKKSSKVVKLEEDNNSVSDHSFDKALGNTFHSQMFDNMNKSSTTAAQTANNNVTDQQNVSFADIVESADRKRQRVNNKSQAEYEL